MITADKSRTTRMGSRSAPPLAPTTLEEAQLSPSMAHDLILRLLEDRGARSGLQLARDIALPFGVFEPVLGELRSRRLVEVRGTRGAPGLGYEYAATEEGRERARRSAARCAYTGPAPVSLSDFTERIKLQSVAGRKVRRAQIAPLLSDLILPADFMDQVGPALVAGHSLFLFGAPGNGKTAVAERLSGLYTDPIFIPHAVQVDGQILTVFDPVQHRRIVRRDENGDDITLRGVSYDRRWVRIVRPSIMVGGELQLSDLDLQYEESTGIYRAPLQVKASGGVLVMDDFGRQKVSPTELLNRWIVPLERRVDHLTLRTGFRFPVPFDCLLIFASNEDPDSIVDEAFFRRIRYKILMDSPDQETYTHIFKNELRRRELDLSPDLVSHIYGRFYRGSDITPRSCHPRDILDHVEDLLRFREGEDGTPTDESLVTTACTTYFLRRPANGETPPHTPELRP